MAQIDDNASQAHERLANLAGLGSDDIAKQYPLPGSYDQAVHQAQQDYTAALTAQSRASKTPPGRTAAQEAASNASAASGNARASTAQQTADASTARGAAATTSAGAAASNAATNASTKPVIAQADADKGQAALDRAGAYAGWTKARIDLAKQAAWAKVQPQLDAIDAQVQSGAMTDTDGATAKQGVIDQAVSDTVTGMTAPQRSTAAYQQGRIGADEGNARATVAGSIYDNQGAQANDAAQHGSIVAGSVLGNRLAAAPGFVASMGGAPMLTQAQKVQIGQNLLNGGSRSDALQAVAQAHSGNLALAGPFDPNAGPRVGQPEGSPATQPMAGAIPPGYGTGAPGTPGSPLSFGAAGPAPVANPNVPAWGPSSPGASAQFVGV